MTSMSAEFLFTDIWMKIARYMASRETSVVSTRSTRSNGMPKKGRINETMNTKVCTTRDLVEPIHRVARSALFSSLALVRGEGVMVLYYKISSTKVKKHSLACILVA